MVTKKIPRAKSGFIVHPFETSNNKYNASYGNHNRTVKSFKTLKASKAYLKRNKIREAIYDNPSGAHTLIILRKKRKGGKK